MVEDIERAAEEHADPGAPAEQATLLQKLHWATGDRDAEAKALADAVADRPEKPTLEDAKIAVQRAHGEGLEEPDDAESSDLATPADAVAVAEERN